MAAASRKLRQGTQFGAIQLALIPPEFFVGVNDVTKGKPKLAAAYKIVTDAAAKARATH